MADAPAPEAAVLKNVVVNLIDDLVKSAKRGVFYVSQDNYVVVRYGNVTEPIRLYADSATSCVVVIVAGKDAHNENMIAMAHLSRPGRFQQFFSLVNTCFRGDIQVYANGGNPAEPIFTKTGFDYTAFRNANIVIDWVKAHRIDMKYLPPPEPGNFYINQAALSFGQGNPSIYTNNLDCFGIQLKDGSVSRNREWLTGAEEDPSGGVQTLFCVHGDPNTIRPQSQSFTPNEIVKLVEAAKAKNFDKAADMSDEQILQTYSSTPEFEVPWFCDTIRTAAKFVASH
jgi:hypothetical protein